MNEQFCCVMILNVILHLNQLLVLKNWCMLNGFYPVIAKRLLHILLVPSIRKLVSLLSALIYSLIFWIYDENSKLPVLNFN